jgi:ubiquinone/menaquinone biosynthesis C-methylase UbiE
VLGFALHRDPDTYRYIPESIRLYPGAHAVARLMEGAGFETVDVIPLLGGLMAIHVAELPATPPITDHHPVSAPATARAR